MQRLGILTSGGDAPGMNAAVRAAVLVARAQGWEVYGVERGYRGLLDGAITPLRSADVRMALRDGGTVLGSARCPEFVTSEARAQARAQLAGHGIDRLLVIGGNGSLAGAALFGSPQDAGGSAPNVIGIPASIDNDIGLTRMAIGVDTAMNTIVDACDKIADTAGAHQRAFLIEVMGRECGYLAMASSVSVGADLVLYPEASASEEALVSKVVHTLRTAHSRRKSGRVMIIVAEGIPIPTQQLKERVDERMALDARSGGPMPVETRVTVLGHVVRGGRPSAFDRLLASRLANVGVRALMAGETEKMVGWDPLVDLVGDAGARSADDPHCWLIGLGAVLDETKRLLDGTSPAVSWRTSAMDDVEEALLL